MMWNYGAIPQTYEDPKVVHPATGAVGDSDPIGACCRLHNLRAPCCHAAHRMPRADVLDIGIKQVRNMWPKPDVSGHSTFSHPSRLYSGARGALYA